MLTPKLLTRIGVAGFTLGLAGMLGPARALEPKDLLSFNAGPFVVQPKLVVSYTYDDNIFHLPDQSAIADSIFTVSPGISFRLGRLEARNQLTFGYTFSDFTYFENSDANGMDHVFNLAAKAAGDRLSSQTTGTFQFLNSILGGYDLFSYGGVIFGHLTSQERMMVQADETATYTISDKTDAYVRGSFSLLDFTKITQLYDRNDWKVYPGFNWKAFDQFSVFSEVYYGQTAANPNFPVLTNLPPGLYTKPAHADSVGGFVGLKGNFTQKLSGSAKVGYESYTQDGKSTGASSPVANLELTWAASQRLSVTLSYNRAPGLAIWSSASAYVQDYADASLRWVTGQAHPFSVTVGGGGGLTDYFGSQAGASSTYYRAHLDLAYAIKTWLHVGMDYQFQQSDYSGNVTSVATDNRIDLYASLGF